MANTLQTVKSLKANYDENSNSNSNSNQLSAVIRIYGKLRLFSTQFERHIFHIDKISSNFNNQSSHSANLSTMGRKLKDTRPYFTTKSTDLQKAFQSLRNKAKPASVGLLIRRNTVRRGNGSIGQSIKQPLRPAHKPRNVHISVQLVRGRQLLQAKTNLNLHPTRLEQRTSWCKKGSMRRPADRSSLVHEWQARQNACRSHGHFCLSVMSPHLSKPDVAEEKERRKGGTLRTIQVSWKLSVSHSTPNASKLSS